MPSSDSYETAQQKFAGEGLPFPYIPPALRDKLVTVDEWFYTTDVPLAKTAPRALLDRLHTDDLPDFALLAQTGHGMNSWFIRYYLAVRPLLLMLEYPWGGAYLENEQAATALRKQFEAAKRLIDAVDKARGTFAANEILVVMHDPAAGGHWLRLTIPAAINPLSLTWNAAEDVLHEALAQV